MSEKAILVGLITPDVCDMSAVGVGGILTTTVNHCDNLTYNESGTDYWGVYNDICVGETPFALANFGGQVHDSACCYAYTLDQFAVYDNELTTDNVINGIRIY